MNSYTNICDIIRLMHEYQANHNVSKQCITNTQYLYDSIKHSNWKNKVTPKAVIVVYNIPEKNETCYAVHLAVQWKDKILEPSYEYAHIQSSYYYDNINNVIKTMKLNQPGFNRDFASSLISKYLLFVKYAEQIEAGEFLVDREYYDLQADYVEEGVTK